LADNDLDINELPKKIEFDNKSDKICNINFSIKFDFTDLNMVALKDLISNLPMLEDPTMRKTIKLGKCMKNISIKMLIELLNISYKRINIEFTQGHKQLMEIMKKDEKFIKDIRDFEDHENNIVKMVE